MEIIGEKINGTRKSVGQAIAERNAAFVQDLAMRQVQAGAHWLDVNAGTRPDQEPADLLWLIECVQAVVDTPLCLDSSNPHALAAAIPATHRTPLINSISGEPQRLEQILPLAARHGCPVIALAVDGKQVPTTCAARMDIIHRLLAATRDAGIADEQVYVDPLAMALATDSNAGLVTLEAIRCVRADYPTAHISLGLSNASFGLPARSHINRAFLTLALAAGLDAAILDPTDRELMAALKAAELVLGRDRRCLGYTRAYRAGLFGSGSSN